MVTQPLLVGPEFKSNLWFQSHYIHYLWNHFLTGAIYNKWNYCWFPISKVVLFAHKAWLETRLLRKSCRTLYAPKKFAGEHTHPHHVPAFSEEPKSNLYLSIEALECNNSQRNVLPGYAEMISPKLTYSLITDIFQLWPGSKKSGPRHLAC